MKRLATVAVLLAIMGSNVLADAKPGGLARQISLGGSVAGSGVVLNPFIMDDPTLMLINPAYQAKYKDYVWMNLGGGTLNGLSTVDNGYGSQFVGVNFGIASTFAIGATFSYDPSAVNLLRTQMPGLAGAAGIYQRTPQSIPAVANVWELMGSLDIGALDLGLGVTYGNSNDETEVSGTTSAKSVADASMFGVRAGINGNLGSGFSLDAAVQFRSDSYNDEVTDLGKYSASATEIVASARGKLKISNKFNFVPYGLYAMVSAEPKEDSKPTAAPAGTTSSLKVSGSAFALGVGGEFNASNLYMAGGLSFQSGSLKSEFSNSAAAASNFDSTMSYSAIPVVNLGAEWWFTDWLAGRMGYYRSLGSVTMKGEHQGATVEQTYTAPNSLLLFPGSLGMVSDGSLVTLGLGFRFGGFALDATVSEEALRRGFGLVGAQDNINTFGYITTSYNFE